MAQFDTIFVHTFCMCTSYYSLHWCWSAPQWEPMTQLTANRHPYPHQFSWLAGRDLVRVERPQWPPHLGDGWGWGDSLWVVNWRFFWVEVAVGSVQTCVVLLLVVPVWAKNNHMMYGALCSQATQTTFWEHSQYVFDVQLPCFSSILIMFWDRNN